MKLQEIRGNELVRQNIWCNGIETSALIDTGAAVTAVTMGFANKLNDPITPLDGPDIILANGQSMSPQQGIALQYYTK